MDGVINIYKERGFTSHDVVAKSRRILGTKKIGHAGTLDPEATGVLILCVGRATKLSDYIMSDKKTYSAELTLGITTDTQDAWGNVILRKQVGFNREDIEIAVNSFIGEYNQLPPMYSAIKIDGKKLYCLARQGKEVERKPRKITIYDIKITEFLPPDKVRFNVTCSKGAYIRTLCADIGEKLGFGGHMSYLSRIASGNFKIEDAITLSNLEELVKNSDLKFLIPPEKALEGYAKVKVKEKGNKILYNGGRIYEELLEEPLPGSEEIVVVYDFSDRLIGIYMPGSDEKGIFIKPLRVLFGNK